MVSGQSFGSCAVSLACITSMCSVQRFPGGHSLRLAFGSFFYRLILAVLLFGQAVSFFVAFSYAWLLCNRCFLVIWADNLGGTFVSAFGHGFCLDVSSATSRFESSTTAWRRCFRETEQLWFCIHLLRGQAVLQLSSEAVHEFSGPFSGQLHKCRLTWYVVAWHTVRISPNGP